MKVEVRIHKTDGNGHNSFHAKPQSVKALKDFVIEKLQKSYWTDKGFTLTPKNIVLFRVTGGRGELVCGDDSLFPSSAEEEKKEEEGATPSSHPTIFYAYEYFEVLPEDLLRRVSLAEAPPNLCTYTNPKYKNQYTRISPLKCGLFRETDQQWPWCEFGARRPKFHGMSLGPVEKDEETAIFVSDNPYELGDSALEKGITFMTLQQYDEVVQQERHPILGILQTEVSHYKNEGGVWVPKRDTVTNREEGDKKGGKKKSRTIFYQFKIQKGVHLAEYGAAVIYDNNSKHHVTLVRTKKLSMEREWRSHHEQKLCLPLDCHGGINECTDANLDSFLREKVFKVRDEEPEALYVMHGARFKKPDLVLPKVAALFALHNLRLEASVEPSPPKGDNSTDDDCKLMYEGAVVLYDQHLGDWNLTLALNELEAVNYKVEDLEVSFCQTIIEALQDIDVETENSQFDEENDGGGVLADMTEILERRVEQVTTSPMMFDLAHQDNNEVVISPQTPAKAGTESLNPSPKDGKSSSSRSSMSAVAAESQTSQAETPQRLRKRIENLTEEQTGLAGETPDILD